jgi:plastocyanin
MKTIAIVVTLALGGTALQGGATEMHFETAPKAGAVTHVVQMRMQDGKFAFEPAEVKAKAGDKVQFVLASGGPHNIAFDAAKIPDAAEPALTKVLTGRIQPLAGPILSKNGDSYTIALDGVPAGRYPFYCMPHMALAMTGVLIVE